ncbi:DUF4376 domain-containing protein [Pseudomonas sp. SWRI74]|uniref:DUF4376 domain-containing protein n=1 Tax=Pseudomonas azerbaijanoccidentalis TaxID=2842347 RepID=A0ABS6QZN6_9PSED|nr:DUF4376 domain-containing protein [Pseudomonas azerbaijanoccidentalis]MBV4524386.1 DUF4376 domain-containing protein [Pseudomonas azerbaijanoccidentalis]
MSAIYLIGLAGVLSGPVTLVVVPGIGCQMPDNGIELPGILPEPAEGFVWALVEGEPVLLADHRGVVYSTATGEPELFNELGELPAGLTLDPRPSPAHAWTEGQWQISAELVTQLHAEAEAQAWELIKADRDRRKEAGFKVGNEWVHSDLFSRSQWLGLKDNARDTLAAGGSMESALLDSEGGPIVWKMLDGSFVPVTAQMAFDVVAAVTRSDMAIFKVAEQHNAAMRAAADPAAYDFTTGWPQTYAESAEIQPVDPETIPPVDPEPETDPESLPDPEEEAPQ